MPKSQENKLIKEKVFVKCKIFILCGSVTQEPPQTKSYNLVTTDPDAAFGVSHLWYLVCSCSEAQCQRGNWCFQGLNGCSRPGAGTRWGSLCV